LLARAFKLTPEDAVCVNAVFQNLHAHLGLSSCGRLPVSLHHYYPLIPHESSSNFAKSSAVQQNPPTPPKPRTDCRKAARRRPRLSPGVRRQPGFLVSTAGNTPSVLPTCDGCTNTGNSPIRSDDFQRAFKAGDICLC